MPGEVPDRCQLIQTLIQHGPADEYRLMVFPIVLGGGKRLFPERMSTSATAQRYVPRPPPDGRINPGGSLTRRVTAHRHS
jgi:dihydrofolate reductase